MEGDKIQLIFETQFNSNRMFAYNSNRSATITMVNLQTNEVKCTSFWSVSNSGDNQSLRACFIRSYFKGDTKMVVADKESGFVRFLDKMTVKYVSDGSRWDSDDWSLFHIDKKDFRKLMMFAAKKSDIKRPMFTAEAMQKATREEIDLVAGAMADHLDEFIEIEKMEKVV